MGAPAKKASSDDAIEKIIVQNRRAAFDYAIDDRFEGGIVLVGSEVKSMRAGKVELVDAYAAVEGGELWLKQMYIAPFEQASAFPHEPRRARKLLVKASLYFRRGRVKVELGLAKGKKTHDKRADIAAKTADREARAAMGRARKERG